MIISVQNQKGGVGKTTLAVHIAHAFSLRGDPVLLIDADPQGSARDWAAAREEKPPFMVVGLDRPTIHRDLPDIGKGYAHIMIDSPPRVTDLARSALIAADLVLIPVQPSPYDVWAAGETVTLAKESSVFKEKLKSVFVINRKISNTVIGRDVTEALKDYGFPILQSQVSQRVAFAETAAQGKTVLDTDPTGSGAKEIAALVNELLEFK